MTEKAVSHSAPPTASFKSNSCDNYDKDGAIEVVAKSKRSTSGPSQSQISSSPLREGTPEPIDTNLKSSGIVDVFRNKSA